MHNLLKRICTFADKSYKFVMEQVNNRIKEMRKQKGMSQGAMAAELGVSQATYGKIEKNEAKLTLDKLDRIAEILNCSTTELLGYESNGNSGKSDKDFAQQYQEIKQLHQENKQVLEKLLESKDEQIEVLKELIRFYKERFNS